MRYQLRVDSRTVTTAPSGQDIESWQPGATYFCGVEWMNSDEKKEGDQKISEKKVKFTIHRIAVISEMDRIFFESGFYEILSVVPIEKDRQLELTCRFKDNGNVS